MPKSPEQRVAAAAQELEYEAVVMSGLANRLFALGCTKDAHETAKAAAVVAKIAKGLRGANSATHVLFFYQGEDPIELGRRRDGPENPPSAAPARDGAGVDMEHIDST